MNDYFTEEEIKELIKLNQISRTKIIIKKVFENKKDKAGKPYINHLKAVAEYFTSPDEIVTALLHDIVEDTEITINDLKKLNYSSNVIEAIDLLTRKNESYEKYIDELVNSNSLIAKKVKMSDLLNNMNLNRLNNPKKEDFERVKNKYIKTYTKVLNSMEKDYLNN